MNYIVLHVSCIVIVYCMVLMCVSTISNVYITRLLFVVDIVLHVAHCMMLMCVC